MGYKVVIKRCEDTQLAQQIAKAVAEWSGASEEKVVSSITKKDVVVKKDASQEEADKIKSKFEQAGATMLVERVGPPPAADPNKIHDDEDEEEEEEEGRVLSEEEYKSVLAQRGDVFQVETDNKMKYIQIVAMILALGMGAFLSTREIIEVATDFFEKVPEERSVEVGEIDKDRLDKEKEKKEEEKEDEIKKKKKKMKKSEAKGEGGRSGGGGDPRSRVTKKGVLGIVSGRVKGKSVASADIFGKGGFASGIDGILKGSGGLKAGGDGGSGRKGAAGIGYGKGYGSGFGGGSGGVDDLVGSLMGGGGGELDVKKRGKLKVSKPNVGKGAGLKGGRSKASIMRVVMQNISALRYAYNKRLRDKPGLKGKITCKFAIDEFGNVVFCKVVSSTINDNTLEKIVTGKVKRWKFGKIDKPGDVTEVVYPFVFSQ